MKAFHLLSVGCVIYGFCGVIFLCKGKGYFSKCYICIVRKNNVNFFLSQKTLLCCGGSMSGLICLSLFAAFIYHVDKR